MRHSHFGELRSMLQQSPSEHVWHRLCAQLSQLPRELLDQEVIPYLIGHLGSWPDALCSTPVAWLERFLRGEDVPELQLCKRLWRAKGCSVAEIRAFAGLDYLKRITTLDLVSCGMSEAVVRAITAPDVFPALVHLDLSFNPIGDLGAKLLASSPSSLTLTSLRLDQCGIRDAGAQALARSPHMVNLKTLTLYNNDLGYWGVEELRRSRYLSKHAQSAWLLSHEL